MATNPLKTWRRSRIALALAVIGPGIIAGNADNDPSGIFGYSVAGAMFQYKLLWLIVLITGTLYVIQEMCARMAVATGKGLADLIREEFGVKVALFAMITLFIANAATTISEFAGMSAAVDLLAGRNIHLLILPILVVGIWLLVMKGSYRGVEKVLLTASFIYLAYIVTALKAHPNWSEVGVGLAVPTLQLNSDYIKTTINLIGTTITPWGLFFIQSSVRDKGMNMRHLKYVRLDMLAGSIFAGLIAFFIVISCGATLFKAGMHLNENASAADAAKALKPLVGGWASIIFAVGLLNAAIYGAIIVPISTAYAITESLGWESGLGRKLKDAPLFAGVYGVLIITSAIVVAFTSHKKLGFLIQLPNIVGGVLLPIILVLALKLVNNKELMGKLVNTRMQNIVTWSTAGVIIVLSLALVVLNFV